MLHKTNPTLAPIKKPPATIKIVSIVPPLDMNVLIIGGLFIEYIRLLIPQINENPSTSNSLTRAKEKSFIIAFLTKLEIGFKLMKSLKNQADTMTKGSK